MRWRPSFATPQFAPASATLREVACHRALISPDVSPSRLVYSSVPTRATTTMMMIAVRVTKPSLFERIEPLFPYGLRRATRVVQV
jgi:hypothetical protein